MRARRRFARTVLAALVLVPLGACSFLGGQQGQDGAAPVPAPAVTAPPVEQIPADQPLTREQVEDLAYNTVTEEFGVPRFVVEQVVESQGGLEAIARRAGATEEQIAQVDGGYTRGEIETFLAPILAEIRSRMNTGG